MWSQLVRPRPGPADGGHHRRDTDLTLNKTSLTFTSTTWDAQTVTVTPSGTNGVTDAVTLTHAVSGGGYDQRDVEVSIT